MALNDPNKGRKTKDPNYSRDRERQLRSATIEALGGTCIRCGFKDSRALQIDHINGGGNVERKERAYRGRFHRHVLRSFLAGENKYQLLCANCNWIKRFENEEIGNRRVDNFLTDKFYE